MTAAATGHLTDHVAALRDDGYVLIRDLLSPRDLAAAQQEALRYFPTCDEFLESPERYRKLSKSTSFPFQGPTLNRICIHPVLTELVERILGTREIRLRAATLQAKYGRLAEQSRDQRLHNDAWQGSGLVYPPESGALQRIFAIVYYTDVTVDLAPTYVVPRAAADEAPRFTDTAVGSYPPADYPRLYEAEQPVTAPAGAALVLTGRTVHRGSAVRADRGHRFAQFMNYHSTAATWLTGGKYDLGPGTPEISAVGSALAQASPRERELVGFPPVGDPYWTGETLGQVERQYPEMDLTPYAR